MAEKHGEDGWDRMRGLIPPAPASVGCVLGPDKTGEGTGFILRSETRIREREAQRSAAWTREKGMKGADQAGAMTTPFAFLQRKNVVRGAVIP